MKVSYTRTLTQVERDEKHVLNFIMWSTIT